MNCERCGRSNDPQAHFCMECGFAFQEGTKLLTDDGQNVVSAESGSEEHEYQELQLSLRIGDSMFMMPFPYRSELILGREQQSVTSTIVDPRQNLYPASKGVPLLLDKPLDYLDLTSYGAEEAGVSRRHVVIRHEGEMLTVEDLGSRNGTYLNRDRLIPGEKRRIQSGDLLFLGKLIVNVAFRNQAVVLVKNPSDDPCR